ncbi:hypothetical protein PDM87_26915 [Bacillus cereus]|nr:hypothetical protein [Bacillus cereus]
MYTDFRDYTKLINTIEHKKSYALSLIDIDDFIKTFNEKNYQRVIAEFNHFFAQESEYMIFYLGKDEFVFLDEGDSQGIGTFIVNMTNLQQIFKNKFGISFTSTISEFPYNGEDYIEIIRGLEESLHDLKKRQKGQIDLVKNMKRKLKSNYYSPIQLERLSTLASNLKRSEASILREALDMIFRKYEK